MEASFSSCWALSCNLWLECNAKQDEEEAVSMVEAEAEGPGGHRVGQGSVLKGAALSTRKGKMRTVCGRGCSVVWLCPPLLSHLLS